MQIIFFGGPGTVSRTNGLIESMLHSSPRTTPELVGYSRLRNSDLEGGSLLRRKQEFRLISLHGLLDNLIRGQDRDILTVCRSLRPQLYALDMSLSRVAAPSSSLHMMLELWSMSLSEDAMNLSRHVFPRHVIG